MEQNNNLREQMEKELDLMIRKYHTEDYIPKLEDNIRKKVNEYREKFGQEYYYSLSRYDGR